MSYFINIKALSVEDLKNGVFCVEVSDRPMSDEEHKIIDKLIPDLKDQFYLLMDKQTLLLAIATHAEINAEPPKPPEGKEKKKMKWVPAFGKETPE